MTCCGSPSRSPATPFDLSNASSRPPCSSITSASRRALALFAANVRTLTLVPGHPSQLPALGEVYGYPTHWPEWVRPDPAGLRELRQRCETTSQMLADTGNRIVGGISPGADRIGDVFGALGATVLYNSPSALHDPARRLPLDHHFLGSCVRAHDVADDETMAWLAVPEPFLYVSLGTFLSGRVDVLRRIVDGLRRDGATRRHRDRKHAHRPTRRPPRGLARTTIPAADRTTAAR